MALHSEVSRLSKYLSTLSKPHSSFTTGMTAGTSRSKWDGEGPNTEQCGSFLAALIASLVAQCTEAARSNGGSPDAATKGTQVSRTENLRVKISEVYLAIYAHTQPPINICKACA
jgi:hypothetical protein